MRGYSHRHCGSVPHTGFPLQTSSSQSARICPRSKTYIRRSFHPLNQYQLTTFITTTNNQQDTFYHRSFSKDLQHAVHHHHLRYHLRRRHGFPNSRPERRTGRPRSLRTAPYVLSTRPISTSARSATNTTTVTEITATPDSIAKRCDSAGYKACADPCEAFGGTAGSAIAQALCIKSCGNIYGC